MTDILIATPSAELLGTATALIEDTKRAQSGINGTSEALDDTAMELSRLSMILNLIRLEKPLQTDTVNRHVQNVVEVCEELRRAMDNIKLTQPRYNRLSQLRSGDENDSKIAAILHNLIRARSELVSQIPLPHVRLPDDIEDALRIYVGALQKTNTVSRQISGRELILPAPAVVTPSQSSDETPMMDHAEFDVPRFADSRDRIEDPNAIEGPSVIIVDNVMQGRTRIMTGNMGIEGPDKPPVTKAVIARNEFRADVQIMTGDSAGEAAANLGQEFWKF